MGLHNAVAGISWTLVFLSSLLCATHGEELHFSPEERLDAIDVQLISTAKNSIDFASYALTDPIVIEALNAADRRGSRSASYSILVKGTTS